jgi:hypothetical protein
MLFKEIIAVYNENYTKQMQNITLLIVKVAGTITTRLCKVIGYRFIKPLKPMVTVCTSCFYSHSLCSLY